MRAILTVVCLMLTGPAFAQSNARFGNVSVGPASSDLDLIGSGGVGRIAFPNGGGLQTKNVVSDCFGLSGIDTDTGLPVTMITICAGSTPTFNLNTAVTVGGAALLPYTDTGSDAILLFNTSTNQLQNLAFGGTCSLASQTLTCTEPVWVYAGWAFGGFLSSAWIFTVALPKWRVRRAMKRRSAWQPA